MSIRIVPYSFSSSKLFLLVLPWCCRSSNSSTSRALQPRRIAMQYPLFLRWTSKLLRVPALHSRTVTFVVVVTSCDCTAIFDVSTWEIQTVACLRVALSSRNIRCHRKQFYIDTFLVDVVPLQEMQAAMEPATSAEPGGVSEVSRSIMSSRAAAVST